jgi:hypothetical protein
MPEWLAGDARQVVARASQQARRLGHDFIGGEHLLYGLACAGGEAGAVLRERGVTPERVEAAFGPAALLPDAPARRRWRRSRPGPGLGPHRAHPPGEEVP